MKHATPMALERLSALLEQIRKRSGLKEKKIGIFYKRSKPFLHFHEDPTGLFADLNIRENFERYPINSQAEWRTLLSAIDHVLDCDRR